MATAKQQLSLLNDALSVRDAEIANLKAALAAANAAHSALHAAATHAYVELRAKYRELQQVSA